MSITSYTIENDNLFILFNDKKIKISTNGLQTLNPILNEYENFDISVNNTLSIPTTDNILSSVNDLTFNDINFDENYISGNISWNNTSIINDNNITHVECFLSMDEMGNNKNEKSLFCIDKNITSFYINNIYLNNYLYLLIYSKSNDNVLQKTPTYLKINELMNVKINNINFIPSISPVDNLIGVISWDDITSNYDGVNIYLSNDGFNKSKNILNDIVTSTTDVEIDNYDISKDNYLLLYTYKIINEKKYESKIFEKILVNNLYEPSDNILETSIYFVGKTTNKSLNGTIIWKYNNIEDKSIKGIKIYLTDTGNVFGDRKNLIATTYDKNIMSYTFYNEPMNILNTLCNKIVIHTYNKHYDYTYSSAYKII